MLNMRCVICGKDSSSCICNDCDDEIAEEDKQAVKEREEREHNYCMNKEKNNG